MNDDNLNSDSTTDEETQEQRSGDIALGDAIRRKAENESESESESTPAESGEVGLDVDVSFNESELAELIERVVPGLSDSERREISLLLDEREKEIFERLDAILLERPTEEPDPEDGSDHTHPEPTGLSEAQRNEVLALIEANAPDETYGGGEYGGGGYGGETGEIDDLKKRLEAMLARLDLSMRDLEKSLSRVVGPTPSQLTSDPHSTAGWGIHFETHYPIRFISATAIANKSGYINFEVHRYDHVEKKSLGVVSSQEVGISGEGQQDIDLDLSVEEPGHYVLTRDKSESPPDADRVALRRTGEDYTGWTADSGDGLTFHGGVDVAGRWNPNRLWYYLADLHIRDDIPNSR